MTGPDRARVRGTQDPTPEEALDPASDKSSKKKPARGGGEKKKPVFRLARLDGRDTLKYEDTADK